MRSVPAPVIPCDLNAYKKHNFNWSINTHFLCRKEVCQDPCHKFCFSLYGLSAENLFEIFEKLDSYRSWTWLDIERQNGTSSGQMEIEKLDTKKMVYNHLASLNFDDDSLYKIEISGAHRLWGIRRDAIFYPIWNDPDHCFYKHKNKNYTKGKAA